MFMQINPIVGSSVSKVSEINFMFLFRVISTIYVFMIYNYLYIYAVFEVLKEAISTAFSWAYNIFHFKSKKSLFFLIILKFDVDI